MGNVPPLGDLTTLSCAGGGVQESEPLSVAVSPPSAVASAFGLGCDWQAPTGVVESVDTLIVTEACAAMLSSEQVSTLLAMEQVPWLAVAVVQVSPPLPGRASVNFTFM